ncbi:hypothetical protein RJ640_030224 [Escallonia rubra]|uniref:Oleosin n=1 Tax=Escallonia rubra TaxID=112253 RepID=A0AA88UPL5_9ASTE|nr:hypothetical protein RJ640_030224 [Escallonia rubra]
MADRGDRDRHQQEGHQHPSDAIKSYLPGAKGGPSTSKVLAVVTLLPIGGVLLVLAALTFTGTLIGLALATPVFVLFSPVLVPAALTLGLAVTGFLTSGAFGITALSSLSWIVNFARRAMGDGIVTEPIDYTRRRAADTAGFMGQKAKEAGQRTQETVRP